VWTVANTLLLFSRCTGKNGSSQDVDSSKRTFLTTNVSLTVITLTKIKLSSILLFFDGGPRCHIDTCYLYPNEDVVFGILKASHFQYGAF
jgi:hypothetical protein